MQYLTIYLEFVKIKIIDATENAGALIALSLSKMAYWVVDILLVWIIVEKFENIGGWTSYEVLLLYAFTLTSYSFAGFILYHPFMNLPSKIRVGDFDEILTKPLNPFLYLTCREFSAGYFSNMITGGVVLYICFTQLQIEMTLTKFGFLILSLLGGALIQGAGFVFSGVPAFWIIKNRALNNLIMRDLLELTRYPLSVYPTIFKVLLTFVFPYAFVNFYPVQFFLTKSDSLVFHSSFQFLTPIIGLVLFWGAYRFWKIGLKHYESTGS